MAAREARAVVAAAARGEARAAASARAASGAPAARAGEAAPPRPPPPKLRIDAIAKAPEPAPRRARARGARGAREEGADDEDRPGGAEASRWPPPRRPPASPRRCARRRARPRAPRRRSRSRSGPCRPRPPTPAAAADAGRARGAAQRADARRAERDAEASIPVSPPARYAEAAAPKQNEQAVERVVRTAAREETAAAGAEAGVPGRPARLARGLRLRPRRGRAQARGHEGRWSTNELLQPGRQLPLRRDQELERIPDVDREEPVSQSGGSLHRASAGSRMPRRDTEPTDGQRMKTLPRSTVTRADAAAARRARRRAGGSQLGPVPRLRVRVLVGGSAGAEGAARRSTGARSASRSRSTSRSV